MWSVEIIACIMLVWGLTFYKAKRQLWIPLIAIALVFLSFFSTLSALVSVLLWAVFLTVALISCVSGIRHPLFTRHMLSYFQRSLPTISQTERIAIEAGDVWWEGELFRGQPDWQKFLNFPKVEISEEEQHFLANQVETLCSMLDDWDIIQNMELPKEVWDYIKKERFLGIAIPKEYGGLGFSALAHSHIVTKIASRSVSVAITVMVPNSLGPAEFIQHFGTEQQKNDYLPRLARGEEIPAFGLTSPEAGSDAGSIPDTGIVCRGEYNGKEVVGLRLNWDKRYITLAPIATLLGLAFKMYDPDHLLGDKEYIGITLCLVPTHLVGVEMGQRHCPAGLAFSNGPIRGKDVFLPLDFLIGGVEMCGKGWGMMMEALSMGRGISLPALGTAAAKLSYRMTGAYCSLREQFNASIGQFEGIEAVLGRMGGMTYLCEATRLFTLSAVMQQVKPTLAAAITKYHLTEMSRKVCNDAMDIHAGRGVQFGPRNYLGSMQQSLPISITVEGANILTRNLIIFGQGVIRCHPYIQTEIQTTLIPDAKLRLEKFDRVLMGHLAYGISNFARVLAYGLTGGYFISTPAKGELGQFYRQLTFMSAALAWVSDIVLVVVGGQLKRREQISARLGDILSALYLGSAVLKYFQNQKEPSEDLPFVRWSMNECLYNIQVAFDAIFNNFKPWWLARLMRKVIFPWGVKYSPPSDETSMQIAAMMQRTSAQRDRLTEHCYVGKGRNDVTGRMEYALRAFEGSQEARHKLRAAISQRKISKQLTFYQQIDAADALGIVTGEELKLLREFAALRWDAIQVDEFQLMRKSETWLKQAGNTDVTFIS